jgi:hypothetical protein
MPVKLSICICTYNRAQSLKGALSSVFSQVGQVLAFLEAGRAARYYWADLWDYRELFAILAWRYIAVRYKQTVIGAAWAIVRPFLTLVAREQSPKRRRP